MTYRPSTSFSYGSLAALGLMVLAVALGLVLPAVGVVDGLLHLDPANAGATSTSPFSLGAVATTFGVCLGIAGLATGLALPAAWALRGAPVALQAVFAAPLFLPTYLAYAGWGTLRGPGSALGEFLSRGDAVRVVVADRVFAIGGLALWAWPIAAFIIAGAARRVPGSLIDTLDLEPVSAVRRARLIVRLLAPSIGASVVLIALVMAGSAIPLHLAQVQTYAIHLWTFMSLTPEPVRVWVAAWPLVVIAVIAGATVVRAADRPVDRPEDRGDPASRRGSPVPMMMALLVLGLSVPAPLVLFAASLHSVRSIPRFWVESGGAVAHSAEIAGIVGVIAAVLVLAAWAVRSLEPPAVVRGSAKGVVVVFAGAAFVPGVLIGSAAASLWNSRMVPRAVGDTDLPLILAHVARFGWLPLVAGWWLGASEGSEQRETRVLFAPGVGGWWRTRVCAGPAAVAGVALAAAALSFHEIESTVLVQAPGSANIAQRLLDLLHYARDEQLAAAAVNLMVVGLLPAVGAGVLMAVGLGRRGIGRGWEPGGGETGG